MKKRGVAILINKTLAFSSEKLIQDKLRTFAVIEGTTGETGESILNLYASNEHAQNFLKEIANINADTAKGMVKHSRGRL